MVAAALDDYGGTLPQFWEVRVRFQLLHALYALVASGYCLVIQRDLMRDLIRRCHQYLGA